MMMMGGGDDDDDVVMTDAGAATATTSAAAAAIVVDDDDDDDNVSPPVVGGGGGGDDDDDDEHVLEDLEIKRAYNAKNGDQLPWVEKYRPHTLESISHQDEVVRTLKQTLSTNNLPHLLFYGPPGTGKTSTVLAMARQLYGPKLMRHRILELNASNERGIDVIRTKVKRFAQVAVSTIAGSKSKYPCPPFKIIVLDEADAMTREAQSALRRIMELYTHVTRFCIICNYVSRIIEPIASRCAKFRFGPLPPDSQHHRLRGIAEAEGVPIDEEAIRHVAAIANGDMRKSITLLQSAQRFVGDGDRITVPLIDDVAGAIPPHVARSLFDVCLSNDFNSIQRQAADTVAAAYPITDVLEEFQSSVLASPAVGDRAKGLVVIRVGEAEKKLVDGADEYLQLLDILSYSVTVFASYPAPSTAAAAAAAAASQRTASSTT